MTLRVSSSAEALAREGAKLFVSEYRRALEARGRFAVVLSGGNAPRKMLELLGGEDFVGEVDWERVHFFWSDERWVMPDHPESNFRMARLALLDRVRVPKENIHRMMTELDNPAETVRDYMRQLRTFFDIGGSDSIPAFDLIYLGLGEDGHTASLFSDSSLTANDSRWVIAPWVPHLRSFRVTLTYSLINHARVVAVLVSGERKATILEAVLQAPKRGSTYPIQEIRPESGQLVWLVDAAASANAQAA